MIETGATRRLVLGADLGGTSTRVTVADATGRRLGSGRGGPGNPVSSPDLAATSLAEALADALHGLDPAAVRAVVLGVAGGSALACGPRRAEFAAVLATAGLGVAPTYVGDVLVAHAAGTSAPDGAVLVAGTGTSVGRVRDGELVRTGSGHGWLLGDDGSGYWLGREAVRVALAALDAGHVPEGLARTTLSHLADLAGRDAPPGTGDVPLAVDETARAAWKRLVVGTAAARPPVRLADLARLVTDAATVGDPAARDVLARAGTTLAASVVPLLAAGEPLVLAGGLLAPGSPLTLAVRDALAATRWTPALEHAGAGEAGAAWLALVGAARTAGAPRPGADVRERLGLSS